MEWLLTFLGFGFGAVLGFVVCVLVVVVLCWFDHQKDCPCPPCFKKRLKKALEQEEFHQQGIEIEKTLQRMKEARKYL